MAGFRAELEAAGTTHDGFGPPERTFKVNIGGIQRNGTGIATHNTGQAFQLVAAGNHADIRLQRHGLFVQQLEGFARIGPTHRQPLADGVQIKHVGRTAQFEHDIVGNIDQSRDGALPCPLKPGFHPGRRLCTRIHTTNNTSGKTTA